MPSASAALEPGSRRPAGRLGDPADASVVVDTHLPLAGIAGVSTGHGGKLYGPNKVAGMKMIVIGP
jgi:hypothetical protein